jgi:hypothetical protein
MLRTNAAAVAGDGIDDFVHSPGSDRDDDVLRTPDRKTVFDKSLSSRRARARKDKKSYYGRCAHTAGKNHVLCRSKGSAIFLPVSYLTEKSFYCSQMPLLFQLGNKWMGSSQCLEFTQPMTQIDGQLRHLS